MQSYLIGCTWIHDPTRTGTHTGPMPMPCPRPGPSIPQVPGDARTAGSACSVTPHSPGPCITPIRQSKRVGPRQQHGSRTHHSFVPSVRRSQLYQTRCTKMSFLKKRETGFNSVLFVAIALHGQ